MVVRLGPISFGFLVPDSAWADKEAITPSVDGFDEAWISRVVAKGLAECGNRMGQGILRDRFHPPDLVDELLPRVHHPGMARQVYEEIHAAGLDPLDAIAVRDSAQQRLHDPFAEEKVTIRGKRMVNHDSGLSVSVAGANVVKPLGLFPSLSFEAAKRPKETESSRFLVQPFCS
jgi:hypothetical protein